MAFRNRELLVSCTTLSARCRLVARLAANRLLAFSKTAALGSRPPLPLISPCARNTIREAISRDTSSSQHAGHAVRRNRTRNAAGTFSGHCQRSRRICEQKCGWPSLSDDERRVQRRVPLGDLVQPLGHPTVPATAHAKSRNESPNPAAERAHEVWSNFSKRAVDTSWTHRCFVTYT